MIVLEYKIKAKQHQYLAIDEAIRTGQFVRNKALRYWMDNKSVNKYDLNKYCRVLAKEFVFASSLNSTARQSSAERAWSGIAKFFDNCKKQVKGKKGFPKFKKHSRSVEYKQSGWKFGKITIAVFPNYTSQDCPACGERIKKSLSTRTHVCKCGYTEDRDVAASINILKKGLSTAGHEGSYAWGETPSWAVGAILSSNGDSMNQESSSL
jgi:transposase